MFNSDWIYQQTSGPDGPLPLEFDRFISNPAQFRIGAFRMKDGQQVWFDRETVTTMSRLMTAVQASSSMPVLMPPVKIDGDLYLDGALGPSGGIGLDVAEADGFERFLVVLTQPRDYVKKAPRFSGAARRYFRAYPAVADALLERHARYNATRERIFELEKAGRAMVFAPTTMPVSNGERSVAKLRAAHQLGLAQARAEMPVWKEWLGLA